MIAVVNDQMSGVKIEVVSAGLAVLNLTTMLCCVVTFVLEALQSPVVSLEVSNGLSEVERVRLLLLFAVLEVCF